MTVITAIVIVCCVVFSSKGVNSAPTQQFSFGTIQGSDTPSQTSGKTVYAYYGIPFADAPVGALRFEAPVPFSGSNPSTVISSSGFRDSCMQVYPTSSMSEDCLHLNIFVPSENTGQEKKVMVWIHGGGYTSGDATPYLFTDMVADNDIIVVTIHYRLGYFGFLGTGDEAVSTNQGLRDQLLALKWVKDNIRSFGGDADDVTIFGESAGAGSVSFLSLSPYSKGLFTKAIMQSGTALAPWSYYTKERAQELLYELAGRLGCFSWWSWKIPGHTVSYHRKIVDCLKEKTPEELNTPPDLPQSPIQDYSQVLYASPWVDGDLIPNFPKTLLRDEGYLQRNGVLDRSYIVGFTNNEGYFLLQELGEEGALEWNSEKNMADLARISSKYYFRLATNDEMVNLIDFVYSYPRESDGQPPLQGMLNLVTDTMFGWPAVEFVNMLTEISPRTDVYLYLFDHYPELLAPQDPDSTRSGTSHAVDLTYLMDISAATDLFAPGVNFDTPDTLALMDVYRNTLAQFAKTGNPSYTGSRALPTVWPRFDGEDRQYFAYGPQPELRKRLYAQRVSLWQDYLSKIATNIFTGKKGIKF